MPVSDYSTTPGSNSAINGISIAEGMRPENVNNAIRQMMADVRSFYDEAGLFIGPLVDSNSAGAVDLNTFTTDGDYFVQGASFSNAPFGSAANDGAGHLSVRTYNSAANAFQYFTHYSYGRTAFRTKVGGSWSNWTEIAIPVASNWLPSLLGVSGGGTAHTYAVRAGRYIADHRTVRFAFELAFSTVDASMLGAVAIGGLPFPAASVGPIPISIGVASNLDIGGTGYTQLTGYFESGTGRILLTGCNLDNGGVATLLTRANLANNFALSGSGFYERA